MLAWMAPLSAEEPPKSDKKEPAKTLAEDEDSADEKDEKPDPILQLAELRLDEFVVPARQINLPIPGKTKTLQDVLDQFEKWSKDEKVGAVLLDLSNLALSLADVEELRAGLGALRDADKKVMAFLNGGGPSAYLLACSCDEIVTPPTGAVMIPGVGALFPYMKGYFQMLGVEFDVIAAGRFKYPGFLNEREPNQFFREEYNAILDSWIADYKKMIADGRKLSPEAVDQIVDTALFSATQAHQRGLVDTLAYYDEYRDRVLKREKMKRRRPDDRGLAGVNSLQDLMGVINDEIQKSEEAQKAVGPKIAVVHARGPIVDFNLGAGFASQLICRDDFIKVIEEVRKNKSIKAVVMRVDSPGGSGYASDMIWQRLRELGDTKPLVVSMGRVAGSGGYYIACPAHRIFAQPTTITGSIGVLGIFQSAWSQYNRMDVELAEMKRGSRATLGAPNRTLSKEDRTFIQEYIDDFYGVFVGRVAQTRKIPEAEVRKIAEGRIYTGRQAKEIGLVDELGGLADAIESARFLANIPPSAELKIIHYPRPSSLGEILESFTAVGMADISTLTTALSAAASVPFESQVSMFATGPSPLCWMATPPFWEMGSSIPTMLGTMPTATMPLNGFAPGRLPAMTPRN